VETELVLPVEHWNEGKRIGLARYERAKRLGLRDSFGQDSAQNHVYGACGEAAFALSMGIPWPHDRSIDGFVEVADVLPNWEVRTCASTGGMKVRRACGDGIRYCDPPGRIVAFVLNSHGSPSYKMVGHVVAGWAQLNRQLSDPNNRGRPAHFVKMIDLALFAPNFHEHHGWLRDPQSPSGWGCAYCPTNFEGETP